MPLNPPIGPGTLDRRAWFSVAAAGLVGLAGPARGADPGKKTQFQIACMTLPYARFPLERALSGIQAAGYRYVAWGTTHLNGSERVPVLAGDAPPERGEGARPALPRPGPGAGTDVRWRIAGSRRCPQAADPAGSRGRRCPGIDDGHDQGQRPLQLWVKNFKELGPFAREHGVRIVVKQHGGNTGTGAALAEITRAVDDEGVKISYDAGNVLDYHDVDPLPDLRACALKSAASASRTTATSPRTRTAAPALVRSTITGCSTPWPSPGQTMPLCCENIFAPLVPAPADPAGIDALARRAREYLEVVILGLHA